MKFPEYIKTRNELLLKMDSEGLKKLCEQVEIPIPKDEKIFLAGMHKVRIFSEAFKEEVKQESRKWLKENGFSENI